MAKVEGKTNMQQFWFRVTCKQIPNSLKSVSQLSESSKKCAACGQWSSWNMSPTDRCQHCEELLADQSILSAASRKEGNEEKKKFEVGLIEIYPSDAWPVVLVKRLVQVVQISFVAIVSFIIWFLTMLAG